jgi:hypothetical protein
VTKDQIIAAALGRMHRANDTALLAAAQTEILAVQDKLELGVTINNGVFVPFFLFSDKTDLTYSANVEAIALPSNFIQEYDEDHEGVLFYYDSTLDDPWVRMRREPWGVIKSRYPGTATYPRYYDIIGGNVYFRPKPDTAGTMRLMYYARASTLDTVSSNPWTNNAAELFINELGFILAGQYTRDKVAVEQFVAGAHREIKRLYASHIAKLEAGRQRQRGDD